MTEYLRFKNPTFHKGTNLTIRRGVKWDTVQKSDIVVVDENNPKHSYQTKINTKVMRFCDLTDLDLKLEHDENCRTVDGLLQELDIIYGDFDTRELVTLVTFDIHDLHMTLEYTKSSSSFR